MKITKIETFIVPPRWLFLKMETDEGIAGWGEPVIEGKAGLTSMEGFTNQWLKF